MIVKPVRKQCLLKTLTQAFWTPLGRTTHGLVDGSSALACWPARTRSDLASSSSLWIYSLVVGDSFCICSPSPRPTPRAPNASLLFFCIPCLSVLTPVSVSLSVPLLSSLAPNDRFQILTSSSGSSFSDLRDHSTTITTTTRHFVTQDPGHGERDLQQLKCSSGLDYKLGLPFSISFSSNSNSNTTRFLLSCLYQPHLHLHLYSTFVNSG